MNLNVKEIKEGDDIFFECQVKANPKASEVLWYFNEVWKNVYKYGLDLNALENLFILKIDGIK